MAVQGLVRYGIRWRIGNGEQVRVWGDKWLPSPSTYQVSSRKLFWGADTQVYELINKEEATWKTDVLKVLFLPHEVDLISSIPLSSRMPTDRRIWALSSNGLFSVRSAYYGALQLYKAETSGTCSDDSLNRRFWKHIWQLSVLHKVRHFVWRACHDILPAKRNLLWMNILQDSRCEGCNQEDETAGHLFWTCPRACEMWQNSKWVFPVESEHCSSFKKLMWCLLMVDQPRSELAAKVGTCAWALWHWSRSVGHVL